MKLKLIKSNYSIKDKESISNMFVIGNGHLGYKGTMEEERKDDKVTFGVIGIYDQYLDKRREPINLFNPLYMSITCDNEKLHYLNSLDHKLTLKINEGLLERKTIYKKLELTTKRFVSSTFDNVVASKIQIKALEDVNLIIHSGIDYDVYDINGPHFKETKTASYKDTIIVKGRTNENKYVSVALKESGATPLRTFSKEKILINEYNITLKKGVIFELTKLCFVNFDSDDSLKNYIDSLGGETYYSLYLSHSKNFKNKFNKAKISLKPDKNAEFALNYSIYELLILGNSNYATSIPARGLSGQVYKGAIFWDTEIFMLPFFLMQDKKIARRLIEYRINTLEGAKSKARRFGYEGAFYAWESQEDGLERCSLYNVTDSKTGEPLRTYFADKQIHISIDVVYAINKYLEFTDDFSILDEGALNVAYEVYKFYLSYSTFKDDKYHFNDVVGPDEYHERVNDNAFTNYHVHFSLLKFVELVKNIYLDNIQEKIKLDEIENFANNIYLTKPNSDGIIEQFDGYFGLENIKASELKSRIIDKKAYLGGPNGLATKTQVIKQADVVALLALYSEHFSYNILKKNYDYYSIRTEHGSSLSNSMHSLLATKIGYEEDAFKYFYESANIDLRTNQKNYAGGIYIGGTHPASNGGAYLSLIWGFLGLEIKNGKYIFNPKIPSKIESIKLGLLEMNEYKEWSFLND